MANYEEQIKQQYQESFGRAPTAEELRSDLENANKYGTGGSLLSDIAARGSNTPGQGDRQDGSASTQGSSSQSNASAWATPQATAPSYSDQLIKQLVDRQVAQDAENKQRNDQLFNMWNQRATQSLAVDRNDPVIRAQADAYSANQERARRNYISDLAEKAGPYANLQGEQRLAAEHAGQASGEFEAQLMGRELEARRNEIAQALSGMAGLLTTDQAQELQRQLALLDQAIKQQNVGLQSRGLDLQALGLGNEMSRALLQNEQFYNQLGFNSADRAAYWDAVRSGLIK